METAESLPQGAVDLADLRDVVLATGPFVSALLATDANTEKAAQRSDARWRTLRSQVAHLGAPQEMLAAIDPLIPDAHLHGRAFLVIAGPDGVIHTEYGPTAPPKDEVRWSPLPHVLPLVAWRQASPPYIVVLADRTGADLHAVRYGAPEIEREVQGDHDVIRKVAPGGWSQHRYQARAEDSWQHNAAEVATAVATLAERVHPRVTIVGGDVRAVALLREALPEREVGDVRVIDGEPPRDGSGEHLPPEVQEVVDETVRQDTDAFLARLAEELGQADKAVTGLAAVAKALSKAQVAVLLLPERGLDRTLWFGDDATLLSTSASDLAGMGVDDPQEAPADDVLIRSAVATGAEVRLVPTFDAPPGDGDLAGEAASPASLLKDGVAALLRWA
jgi:hypothetical protein